MAGRTSAPLAEHGTRRRYQSRVAPCRCADCRGANAAHQAARRAAIRSHTGVQLTIPRAAYERVEVDR